MCYIKHIMHTLEILPSGRTQMRGQIMSYYSKDRLGFANPLQRSWGPGIPRSHCIVLHCLSYIHREDFLAEH
jgi:hypothetical protein